MLRHNDIVDGLLVSSSNSQTIFAARKKKKSPTEIDIIISYILSFLQSICHTHFVYVCSVCYRDAGAYVSFNS